MSGKRRLAGLAMTAAVLAGTAAAAPLAQDDAPAPASSPALSPEAEGVAQVVTAAALADWGRERNDPGALIMAARLLSEIPMRQGGGEGGPALLTPTRLLDEAAALSGGNQTLIDAIDRLREPLTRGVRSSPFGAGPVFTVKQLRARENWAFELEARGGEVLRVAAIGDGDTNIDLAVRDARGAVLCRDGFGDHYPVCTVAPRANGKMTIDIVNRGDVWTNIQVLSN